MKLLTISTTLISLSLFEASDIKQQFVDLRHKEIFGGYSCNNLGFDGQPRNLTIPNISDLPGCEITIDNSDDKKTYKFYLCTQPSELGKLELRYRSTGWKCYP